VSPAQQQRKRCSASASLLEIGGFYEVLEMVAARIAGEQIRQGLEHLNAGFFF
jgi:hypothetical protein